MCLHSPQEPPPPPLHLGCRIRALSIVLFVQTITTVLSYWRTVIQLAPLLHLPSLRPHP